MSSSNKDGPGKRLKELITEAEAEGRDVVEIPTEFAHELVLALGGRPPLTQAMRRRESAFVSAAKGRKRELMAEGMSRGAAKKKAAQELVDKFAGGGKGKRRVTLSTAIRMIEGP